MPAKAEAYSAYLRILSDSELYSTAKRLFMREHFRGRQYWKTDLCLDECLRRNELIANIARRDAEFLIISMEEYMKELHIVDILRIDFMTSDEINAIIQKIGASPVFPQTSEELVEQTTLLDIIGISKDNLVICNVAGASMEGKIEEGDTLFVDTSALPNSGNVVIADIDGNLLVKRYNASNGKITLLSDNPAFKPIIVLPTMNFSVFGVVKRILKDI